jgi:serine/threonine protein kinase
VLLGEGVTCGHYRILAQLGAAGMGEAYRALDMRLGRDVALKVLSPAFAHDPALRRVLMDPPIDRKGLTTNSRDTRLLRVAGLEGLQ